MPYLKTKEASESYLVLLDDMLMAKRSEVVEMQGPKLQQEAALEYAIDAVKGRMALLGWLKS